MKRMTGEMLAAVGGLLCFLVFAAAYAVQERSLSGSVAALPATAFERGEYYFNSGDDPDGAYDLDLARTYYEQAIREAPQGNERAWYQLGRIEFLEGDFDAAIRDFDKQKEYFGDDVFEVNYMLGLTYAYKAQRTKNASDWQRAEAAFNAFLEGEPQSPWAHTDLAWVYFSQGRYEEMVPLVTDGLSYNPNSPWLHNMLGLALLNTGHRDAARDQFEAAKKYADMLTVEDWGSAYPGNNPDDWPTGLASFQQAIDTNLALAQQ
jgi:tetratricopeptide (TPR) repeat protein